MGAQPLISMQQVATRALSYWLLEEKWRRIMSTLPNCCRLVAGSFSLLLSPGVLILQKAAPLPSVGRHRHLFLLIRFFSYWSFFIFLLLFRFCRQVITVVEFFPFLAAYDDLFFFQVRNSASSGLTVRRRRLQKSVARAFCIGTYGENDPTSALERERSILQLLMPQKEERNQPANDEE